LVSGSGQGLGIQSEAARKTCCWLIRRFHLPFDAACPLIMVEFRVN
jgi:hypothetical protein